MSDKKEQIKTVAIVVLILIVVFGGSYFVSQSKDENTSSTYKNSTNESTNKDTTSVVTQAQNDATTVTEEDRKTSNKIGVDEYLDMYNGNEEKIIYIWKTGCSYCEIETPIIEGLAKEYNLDINALNLGDLSEEELTTFVESNEYYTSDDGFGTPLLLIVKDGKFVDKVTGLSTKDYFVSFFKEYGFISE